MKTCDFCGAEISAGDKNCPICGFEIQPDADSPGRISKTRNDGYDPLSTNRPAVSHPKQKSKATKAKWKPRNNTLGYIIPMIAFAICFISVSLASAVLILQQNAKEEHLTENSVDTVPSISYAVTRYGAELDRSNMDSSRSFTANNAVDGDHNTCWCVNTNEWGGEGAEIGFFLSEKTYVHGVRIINGNQYAPNDDLYDLNGQVSSFKLRFFDENGNEIKSEMFNIGYNSGDQDAWQTIGFSDAVYTDRIDLQVVSSFAGSLYQTNVCITEVEFY